MSSYFEFLDTYEALNLCVYVGCLISMLSLQEKISNVSSYFEFCGISSRRAEVTHCIIIPHPVNEEGMSFL